MANLTNLERLNPQVRKLVEPYLDELLEIHQDNIVSIFICGQAAGADYRPRVSNINLFIILEKLVFSDLQKSLKAISKGIRKKIAAPLFLTRKHMETSTDVFPIEFLEMQENHITVFGPDILSSLQINPANLRLFCEEQIKGKLIRIRQAYLEIGLKRKGIEALLKESLASLTPVFRNLIRLKGNTPPVSKDEIYAQLGADFSLDSNVFLAILRDTKNDEKIGSQDVEVFFEKYINQIQKLAIVVDHAAKPVIRGGAEPDAAWFDGMSKLAQNEQVYCKLSGLVTEHGEGWTVNALRPVFEHLLNVFTLDRLMWGSDWPVLELDGSYVQWFSCVNSLISDLSSTERDQILGDSAARFYGLVNK